MITHILFDFFGTLVEYSDSRIGQGYELSHSIVLSSGVNIKYPEFLERWDAMFRKFDLAAEANQDEFSMDDVVNGFLSSVLDKDPTPELVKNFRDVYLQEWNKGVKTIEGVPELLRQLKGHYTLALVTNTHSGDFVRSHLHDMGIAEHFSAIVASVEHGKRKPHPSIFELALEATGGKSENALYVGDSFSTDYMGAKNVGMRCLLIDPHKKHDIPPEDRIAHILDLRHILLRNQ
ncbi:MAG: HAD family hydrolase [Anaerolineales bacterium]|nr:HAD family hydrolase [Anaerolineales bacterium]